MPDGTIVTNVPDDMTQAELMRRYRDTRGSPEPEERSMLRDASRMPGLALRQVVEGAANTAGMFVDPFQQLLGTRKASEGVSGMLDYFGLPKPETPAEELGAAGGRAAAGGALFTGAAGLLPHLAKAPQYINNILAQKPMTQVVQSGIGGLASEGTRQAGGGPMAQLMAAVFTPSIATSTANIIGGAGRRVGTALPFGFGDDLATRAAQQRIATAIAQDEVDIPRVTRKMGQLGDEARIADSAGTSTANLLDTMATLPGKTKNRVDELIRTRRATTPRRLDVVATELSGGARAAETFDALQAAKKAAADPAYAAIRDVAVPITPTLESLMQRPAFREAFDQAVTTEANFGRQMPLLEDLLQAGGGVRVGFWDNVKRGLDDVIAAKKRNLSVVTPSNKNQAQSTLSSSLDIKHALVDEIDKLTGGAYKTARDAYAGPAAMQSALLDGRSVWTMATDDIRAATAKMSVSEREAFNVGAGEVLRDMAGSPSGQTRLLNAWKDRTLREKLLAIYGDSQSYHRALAVILKEGQLRKLEGKVGGGSQTAGRDARIEGENLGMIEDAARAAATGNVGSIVELAKKTYSRVAMPESVRNEIGRILMSGGPKGRQELVTLEDIMREVTGRNALKTPFSGLLGGAFSQ